MVIKTFWHGLSARLLLLTILFVLLAEILIFVPSIARFRRDWLQDKADQAYLIALAARAAPSGMLTPDIERDVLERLQATHMRVEWPKSNTAPIINLRTSPVLAEDAQFDLYQHHVVTLIMDALRVLGRRDDRLIILNAMPTGSQAMVTLALYEQPLAAAARDFAIRIFWLSLVISVIAGGLVFLSLNRLLIRPIRRITQSMITFRAHPETENTIIIPSQRRDEIGRAERELHYMQQGLRTALHQKTRLAMLGTGLAKINHDLRNILSTAALLSERLASSRDDGIRSIAPRMETALDRAISLCEDTLSYARDGRIPLRPECFDLVQLINDIVRELQPEAPKLAWVIDGPPNWMIDADREQIARVIHNLARNAWQAGADKIQFDLRPEQHQLDVTDTGPGLPPRAREFLFVPFAASVRTGGTGLGLALAHDIMRAHGGDLVLVRSDAAGTVFRLDFA